MQPTYMPLCVCGTTLTDIRNPDVLAKWQDREGDAWLRRENGTPYWQFCVDCHMRRWPNDRRCRNSASKPAPPWLNYSCSGVRRLFAGDFFLTQPPPEVVSPSERAESETRRVRPRLLSP
eukprot:4818168-Karenia_brevis.AAC.1